MKLTLRSLLVALLASLSTLTSVAQPTFVDLDQLGLKVTEAKVVSELRLTGQGDFKIQAKENSKLVVVTLAGEMKSAGQYAVFPALFAVRYKTESEMSVGQASVEVAGAHHIEAYSDHWGANSVVQRTKPGPVTIRFAVTLPEKVQEFTVCIATGSLNVTRLPQTIQAGNPAQASP